MHEATFGGFHVQSGEAVGDGAEAERGGTGLKGLGVESDYGWENGLVLWFDGGGGVR